MTDSLPLRLRQEIERAEPPWADHRRVGALLADICGKDHTELFILKTAVSAGVVPALRDPAEFVPLEILLARLTAKLQHGFGLDRARARWAVETWAFALGVGGGPGEDMSLPQADSEARVQEQAQSAPPRGGEVLVVSGAGRAHYGDLVEAVARAPQGSTIKVRPGLYRGGVTLDKSVEIKGEGNQEDIVIECADAPCLTVATDEARISGISVRGRRKAGGPDFFALEITRGRPIIEDVDVTSTCESACVGIQRNGTHAVLRRCRIHDGRRTGIFIFGGASGTIEDCDIHSHDASGVAIDASADNPVVRACRINRNGDFGVAVLNGGVARIEGCDLTGNGKGSWVIGESSRVTTRDNRIDRVRGGPRPSSPSPPPISPAVSSPSDPDDSEEPIRRTKLGPPTWRDLWRKVVPGRAELQPPTTDRETVLRVTVSPHKRTAGCPYCGTPTPLPGKLPGQWTIVCRRCGRDASYQRLRHEP